MNIELLNYICCPTCKSKLVGKNMIGAHDNITDGVLECSGCEEVYPIIESIPVIISKAKIVHYMHNQEHLNILFRHNILSTNPCNASDDDHIKATSSQQWGMQREIDTFTSNKQDDKISDTFTSRFFFEELQLDEHALKGKVILDACCGGGRGLMHSVKLGRLVFGIDISETLYQLKDHFKEALQHNLFLIRCDACALPFNNAFFDIIYSQRALHHLPSFDSGIKELTRTLRTNGSISFSVYSRENNAIMIYIVEPLRHAINAIAGIKGIKIVSWIIAAAVFPFLKLYCWLVGNKQVPLVFHKLFTHWGSFDFNRFRYHVVFDLLQAPKAVYLKKSAIVNVLARNTIVPLSMFCQHNMVWCFNGRKDFDQLEK